MSDNDIPEHITLDDSSEGDEIINKENDEKYPGRDEETFCNDIKKILKEL